MNRLGKHRDVLKRLRETRIVPGEKDEELSRLRGLVNEQEESLRQLTEATLKESQTYRDKSEAAVRCIEEERKKTHGLQQELSQVQKELLENRQLIQNYRGLIDRASNRIEEGREKTHSLLKELSENREKNEAALAVHAEERRSLLSFLGKVDVKNIEELKTPLIDSDLLKIISSQQEELHRLEIKIQEKDTDNEHLESSVKLLQNEQNLAEGRMQHLAEMYRGKVDETQSVRLMLSRCEREQQEELSRLARERLQDLTDAEERRKTQQKFTTRILTRALSRLKSTREKLAGEKEILDTTRRTLNRTRNELNIAQGQARQLPKVRQQNTEKDQIIEFMQQELVQLQRRNAENFRTITILNQNVAHYMQLSEELREKKNEESKNLAYAQEQTTKALNSQIETQKELAEKRREAYILTTKLQQQDREIQDLRQRLDDALQETATARNWQMEAQKKLAEKKREADILTLQIRQQHHGGEKLKQSLDDALQEKARARDLQIAAEKELEDKREHMDELISRLHEQHREKKRLGQNLDDAREELEHNREDHQVHIKKLREDWISTVDHLQQQLDEKEEKLLHATRRLERSRQDKHTLLLAFNEWFGKADVQRIT